MISSSRVMSQPMCPLVSLESHFDLLPKPQSMDI
jgi:hypothetical protein